MFDEMGGIVMQSSLRDALEQLRGVAKGHDSARSNVIGEEIAKPHVSLRRLPGGEGFSCQSRHRNDTIRNQDSVCRHRSLKVSLLDSFLILGDMIEGRETVEVVVDVNPRLVFVCLEIACL